MIEEWLAYQEDSTARLMQRELVIVPETMTEGDAVDYLRDAAENEKINLPDNFYSIFVVTHNISQKVTFHWILC